MRNIIKGGLWAALFFSCAVLAAIFLMPSVKAETGFVYDITYEHFVLYADDGQAVLRAKEEIAAGERAVSEFGFVYDNVVYKYTAIDENLEARACGTAGMKDAAVYSQVRGASVKEISTGAFSDENVVSVHIFGTPIIKHHAFPHNSSVVKIFVYGNVTTEGHAYGNGNILYNSNTQNFITFSKSFLAERLDSILSEEFTEENYSREEYAALRAAAANGKQVILSAESMEKSAAYFFDTYILLCGIKTLAQTGELSAKRQEAAALIDQGDLDELDKGKYKLLIALAPDVWTVDAVMELYDIQVRIDSSSKESLEQMLSELEERVEVLEAGLSEATGDKERLERIETEIDLINAAISEIKLDIALIKSKEETDKEKEEKTEVKREEAKEGTQMVLVNLLTVLNPEFGSVNAPEGSVMTEEEMFASLAKFYDEAGIASIMAYYKVAKAQINMADTEEDMQAIVELFEANVKTVQTKSEIEAAGDGLGYITWFIAGLIVLIVALTALIVLFIITRMKVVKRIESLEVEKDELQ